jgi:hypothetical protein
MDEQLVFPLLIGFLVAGFLLALLGYGLFLHRQAAIEAGLKQELLHRGMSADDIVRVLKATKTVGSPLDLQLRNLELANETQLKETELKLQYELKQAELKLKQEMVERGMSADEIVRVLQASRIDAGQERATDAMPPQRVQKVEPGGFFIKE